MEPFVMEIAGCTFGVQPLFGSTKAYCASFLVDAEPEYRITVSRNELIREQELLDHEADEERLKRRKFSDMFLERSVIQRRVAEAMLEQDTLMVHGSTVAVDGQAYLFTAGCGTGKSTHTRLWRELFGKRAVMVNDDKPFLRLTQNAVFAYGSPWTGKHGLGNNVCFPVKGICILTRGAINSIVPANPEAALEMLRYQTFVPEDGSLRERSFELIDNLAKQVRLWQMQCNRDQDAARISYEAMYK